MEEEIVDIAIAKDSVSFVVNSDMSFAAFENVNMDDVQSKQMLDVLIDKYPELWFADYMSKVFVSKHRDYAFQRLLDNGSLNADDLLIEMVEPMDTHMTTHLIDSSVN